MKQYIRTAALAALALTAAGAAQAVTTTITFDNLPPSATAPFLDIGLFAHNNTFTQNGFVMQTFSVLTTATTDDLVGSLINGSDVAGNCESLNCPTGNSSTYFASLNDGVLLLGAEDDSKFSISGFDYSFIGAGGETHADIPLVLRLQAFTSPTTFKLINIPVSGAKDGKFTFTRSNLSAAAASETFTQIAFLGFACESSGSCAAFSTNRAQFALDNITVTPVPEPSEWLLMGLGLAALAPIVRRRRMTA